MTTTNEEWRRALADIITYGHVVAPNSAGAEWRGRTSHELIAYRTVVPMDRPVLLEPARNLSHKFMCAEAAWVASGDNRVSTIKPFAKKIRQFSDDGIRFFGAYGPRFVDQLSYVTSTLAKDAASRQAVIEVWREQPRTTNDTPCTLSWQYLIREGRLHCVATMRSSDVWTGWVYDVFNFAVTAAIVAIELRAVQSGIKAVVNNRQTSDEVPSALAGLTLGNLYLTAGSQHLYELDRLIAHQLVKGLPTAGQEVNPLDLAEFATGQDLIDHLWSLARGEPTDKRWLTELFPKVTT